MTDLAMCLIFRLTCGEGSLSLCGEERLVGVPARSVALARLIVRNRTHNLPRPKNTLGRGRLWVRFRTINRASATLRAGTPTNLSSPQRDKLPSPQVTRRIKHMARSVRFIQTEVPRVPRDVFLWRRGVSTKNTLGRGRLCVRFRTINWASATLRAGTPTSPHHRGTSSPHHK